MGEHDACPGSSWRGRSGQAAKGLQRHGLPANSGAVHGARYNARVLAGHIARTRFGIEPARPAIDRGARGRLARDRARRRPRAVPPARLSRAGADRRSGRRASATTASSRWRTSSTPSGPDAIAITLEADGSGAIYPVVFTRRAGVISERMIAPDPLGRHDTPDARAALTEAVGRIARA